ncbi:hypothetical protein [Endothiovibrio diazotrophicus]
MTDTALPFHSTADLRRAFEEGLGRLLDHDGLGPFILVAANATFDAEVYATLEERLRHRFGELERHYREALAEGHPLRDTDDDLMVMLKMIAVGFDRLRKTETRAVGPWEVQYNHLRSFRPPRASGTAVATLRQPFNPDGFHFNKPFLEKECFWRGELEGRPVALLYNKYPFVDLHGLLVPEGPAGHPQFLEEAHHHYIWQLTAALGERLDGVGFGYNALGAHASVNHLHFQLFARAEPLPVAHSRWRHNGGGEPYPARCEAFDSATTAWEYIARLHRRGITYNLIYLPGRLLCLPRKPQGECPIPPWGAGLSWYEMSGGMLTFNHHDFDQLSEAPVTTLLADASLAP